jgi:hypothetical protein
VADALSNGSKFRLLTVADVLSRQALAIEVGSRLRGENVVQMLNRLVARPGAPEFVFVDNAGEFTARPMDMWACRHHLRIDFSRPGNLTIAAMSRRSTTRCETPHSRCSRTRQTRRISCGRLGLLPRAATKFRSKNRGSAL